MQRVASGILKRDLSRDEGSHIPLQDNVVVAVGRDEAKLAKIQAHDRVVCDVLDSSAVVKAFEAIAQRHGPIDGVANCVGNLARSALTTSDDEFLDILRVNLVSCFNILRPAVRTMMGSPKGGSIVFISAACARFGLPSYDAFAAAKGGVIGLTLGASSTYAKNQVRVNCVAPGLVRALRSTHLHPTRCPQVSDGLTEYIMDKPEARKLTEEVHALQRVGTPLDVAYALEYLLSERANFVTGQVLGVDGGLASSKSSDWH